MMLKWCWKGRCYQILFSFLLINVLIYFIAFGNWFDNTPDGTVIDFSDAHRKELIESYRKELEWKRHDRIVKSKNGLSQGNEKRKDDTETNLSLDQIADVNDVENPEEGSSRRKAGNIPNSHDIDLADIFDDSAKLDSHKNVKKETPKEPEKSIERVNYKLDEKELNFDYDTGGNIIVNAAALLDYQQKVANTSKIVEKKTIPYKCWEGAFYTEPYLLSKDLGAVDFECMDLRVTPSTPICLYRSEEDVFISAYLRYNGLWEIHIVDLMQRALSKDEELGLIDLGANLGQYALIAAKMGRKVFAVEPYSQTLKRFQKAAQMGNVIPNIRVLKNAITDVRTDMYIHLNPDNMGDARVDTDNSTCKHNCEIVKSILLSDIVPYLNFNKAVLKIDIQGFEDVIFYYADHLLDSVYIPYIFMEWVLLREFYIHKDHRSNQKRDVEYTITYLTARGYVAYSCVNGKKLNLEFWGGWPEDVYWVMQTSNHHGAFNLDLDVNAKSEENDEWWKGSE